jgi:hypothetical protein
MAAPAGTTTEEYWDINGVSLSEQGWNVKTIGGSRYGVPPMRGTNIQYAYVPGTEFRRKIPDTRTITLEMWVNAFDPLTGLGNTDQIVRWNDSWQFLRHLFWDPDNQFVLTRRWKVTDPVTHIASVVAASALGQLGSTLDLTMTGRTRADFSVDVVLNDPFFYGAAVASTVPAGGSLTTIVNAGDYTAAHRNMSVQFVGPLTTPTLTNTSPNPQVKVTLNTTVGAGETVTLDCHAFTAISNQALFTTAGVGSYNRIAYVVHSGARQWMGLRRGSNTLRLDAASGSGHAVVTFQPPYV